MSESKEMVAEELETLLLTERDALLKGDLNGIEGLLERKTAMLEQLRALAGPLSPDKLNALSQAAERNNELFVQASKGLERVRERLDALIEARDGFRTYGSDGQMTQAGASKATERRI